MATIAALVIVIALLLAERAISGRAERAERARLTNALMARHPGEFIALQRTDGDRPARQPRERTDDAPVIGL